ncbi:hypothetical protein EDB82DRAFT_486544 [Fusarium venenatum]|nr:hypothetical protein EDB82DRAFT_486544 [Fusarium venenatum]
MSYYQGPLHPQINPTPFLTLEEAEDAKHKTRFIDRILQKENHKTKWNMTRDHMSAIIANPNLITWDDNDTEGRVIIQALDKLLDLSEVHLNKGARGRQSGDKKEKEDKASRDKNAIKNASTRDNHSCVIMGTANPEMAYLFPLAATSINAAVKRTLGCFGALKTLMDTDFHDTYRPRASQLKGFEGPGNLIAINKQQHTWFDRAFWAFEPLEPDDEEPCVVTLKSHWLPACRTRHPEYAVLDDSFNDSINRFLRELTQAHDEGLKPRRLKVGTGVLRAHLKTGEEVRSGHLFKIQHGSVENAQYCRDMALVHWRLVRMSVFRGITEIEGPLPVGDVGHDDLDDHDGTPSKGKGKAPDQRQGRPSTGEDSSPKRLRRTASSSSTARLSSI